MEDKRANECIPGWSNLQSDYQSIAQKANEEQDPGIATLLKGILDALSKHDRTPIDKAVSLAKPNLPDYMVNRLAGAALFDLGFHDEGLKLIRLATLTDVTLDSFEYLAIRLRDLDLFEEARDTFQKLLDEDPSNLNGLIGVGSTLNKMGNHSEAIKTYKQAIEYYPHDMGLHRDLAAVYAQSGDFDNAIQTILSQGISRIVEDYESLNFLGNFYLRIDDLEKAYQCVQRSLELKPNNNYAITMLHDISSQQE